MENTRYESQKQKSPDLAESEHYRPDPNRCTAYLIGLALLAAIIYFVQRIFTAWGASNHFLASYLGDFLALPVYLPLSLYLAHRLGLLGPSFTLKFSHILGAVLIFSLIFEGIIPLLDPRSIADTGDILAYLLGGMLVYFVSESCLKRTAN
jgi:hypothetical protein